MKTSQKRATDVSYGSTANVVALGEANPKGKLEGDERAHKQVGQRDDASHGRIRA